MGGGGWGEGRWVGAPLGWVKGRSPRFGPPRPCARREARAGLSARCTPSAAHGQCTPGATSRRHVTRGARAVTGTLPRARTGAHSPNTGRSASLMEDSQASPRRGRARAARRCQRVARARARWSSAVLRLMAQVASVPRLPRAHVLVAAAMHRCAKLPPRRRSRSSRTTREGCHPSRTPPPPRRRGAVARFCPACPPSRARLHTTTALPSPQVGPHVHRASLRAQGAPAPTAPALPRSHLTRCQPS